MEFVTDSMEFVKVMCLFVYHLSHWYVPHYMSDLVFTGSSWLISEEQIGCNCISSETLVVSETWSLLGKTLNNVMFLMRTTCRLSFN